MKKRNTIHISLPQQLIEIIEEEVKNGGYNSVSEFFRTLIRKWKFEQNQKESKK